MKKNALIILLIGVVVLFTGCSNLAHAEGVDEVSTASEASMLKKSFGTGDSMAQVEEENSRQEIITSTKNFKLKIKKLYEKDSDMTVTCKTENHYGDCTFSWDYSIRKQTDYSYRVYVNNIKCDNCNFKVITSENVAKYMNKVLGYVTLEGTRGVDECSYDLYIYNIRNGENIDASDFQRLVFSKLNNKEEVVYDSYDGECLRAAHEALGCISSRLVDLYNGGITAILDADIDFDAEKSDKSQHLIRGNYTYDVSLSKDELKLNSVVNDVKTEMTIKIK